MPRRGGRHQVLVKGAERAMDAFKMEIATDLGIDNMIDGNTQALTTVQAGSIGGEMVRRIQAAGEWAIKQRYENNEPRLMPEDVLPKPEDVQAVSNRGNQIEQDTQHVH